MSAVHVYWQGIDSAGRPAEGILQQEGSREKLRQQLHAQGKFQLQLWTINPHQLQRPLSAAWLLQVIQEWHQLAQSGMPLRKCLRFLIQAQSHPVHKYRLYRALQALEEGRSLEWAFRHAQGFPELFLRLLVVAENSDQLPLILQALLQLYQAEEHERRLRWKILRYPLTVLGFALLIFFATVLLLIPLFRRLYLSQGEDLFWLSGWLLHLSDSLRLQPLPWLLGSLGSLLLLALLAPQIHWSHWTQRLPGWGSLQRTLQLQLYAQALALMTQVNLPLLEALQLAESLLPDSQQVRHQRVQHSLLQGQSVFQAYQDADFFRPEQLRLLGLGESSEQLGYAYRHIAAQLQEDVQRERHRLQALLQPLSMMVIASLVLAILLALYLPLFQLGQLS